MSSPAKPGHQYKITIIGNSQVGKSSLLRFYQSGEADNSSSATLGSDFFLASEEIDGVKVKLVVWDTAGQEKFRAVSVNNLRHAKGVVVAYSVEDRQSFEDVKRWIDDVNSTCEGFALALVANKSDIESRAVSTEEGRDLARKLGVPLYETSIFLSKAPPSTVSIRQVFREIAGKILENEKSQKNEEKGEKLIAKKKKKSSCCSC